MIIIAPVKDHATGRENAVLKISGYVLMTFLLFFCGCSNETEKKLVGSWQEISNPKGRLEFRSDHTGRAYWPGDYGEQQSSDMKWEILKNENKVSVITPPGPVNFEIKTDRLVAPNGVQLAKVK
jgi:hypothetical protein